MSLTISLSVLSGQIGDSVTITADTGNFSDPYTKNVITFNGVIATILSGNSTELVVTVPQLSSTGPVKAETFSTNLNATATPDFEITYDDEAFDNDITPDPYHKGSINGRVKTLGMEPSHTAIYNRDYSYSNFVEIVDENSMVQNLFSIILTGKNERIWEPTFGTNIESIMFQLIDDPEQLQTALLNETESSII